MITDEQIRALNRNDLVELTTKLMRACNVGQTTTHVAVIDGLQDGGELEIWKRAFGSYPDPA